MPITYGKKSGQVTWDAAGMARHRLDEGLHNPRGGIGRVPVVPAHRPRPPRGAWPNTWTYKAYASS